MWEKTGIQPTLLASEPEVPAAGEQAWELFWRLQSQRSAGMGPNPIDARMIRDHCALMRIEITPWEASAILEMEARAYWVFRGDKSEQKDAPPMLPATSENIRDVFKNLKGGKKNG